jgi:hypothetical protein
MLGKFELLPYDSSSQALSNSALQKVDDVRAFIETNIKPGREASLAMTKVEECFMWIGKAIRNDQYERQFKKEE